MRPSKRPLCLLITAMFILTVFIGIPTNVIATPEVYITPTHLDFTAIEGSTDIKTLTIGNSGSSSLDWSIKQQYSIFDDFPTTSRNATIWDVFQDSPTISDLGDNEPSPNYCMNLDGSDMLFSVEYNLTNCFNATIDFYHQAGGLGGVPESNEYLSLRYLNKTHDWVEPFREYGGLDETNFTFERIFLGSDAFHDNFKFSFSSYCSISDDDFFIDDVYFNYTTGMGGWLSPSSGSGVVSASSTTDVTITADSSTMSPGYYDTTAFLTTNDADEQTVDIPITFMVYSDTHDLVMESMEIAHSGTIQAGQPVTVNGTVFNMGSSGESSVDVQLKDDGAVKTTSTITSIASWTRQNVTFSWVPTYEDIHTVEIYIVPVEGESISDNNAMNKTRNVIAYPDIRVSDSSFDVSVVAGEVKTETFTIHNDGYKNLSASISDNIMEFGQRRILAYSQYADMGSNDEFYNTFKGINTVTTDYIYTSLTSFGDLDTQIVDKDILLIPDQDSGTTIYDTIGTEWESTLKDFLNGGGTVIVCDYGARTARILREAGLFSFTNEASFSGTLEVVAPRHQLAIGVSSTFSSSSHTSYFLNGDGTAVVTDSNDRPVVIHKTYGKGNIVVIGHDFSTSGNSNFGRIVGNAVKYISPWIGIHEWLSENRTSVTVPPRDNVDITLSIDATYLESGQYRANLTITHDDPYQDIIKIPINLTVTKAPHDIKMKSVYIPEWGECGFNNTVNATVLNIGTNPETSVEVKLKIDGVTIDSKTISSLGVNALSNVSFLWTVLEEDQHLVELSITPVDNENNTWNNALNGTIPMTAYSHIALGTSEMDFTVVEETYSQKNITVYNNGFNDLLFDVIGPITDHEDYTITMDELTWLDGVSDGTKLNVGSNGWITLSLPFKFEFYGEGFTTMHLNENGLLSFQGQVPSDPTDVDLPTTAWKLTLFPMFCDWVQTSGGIYIQALENPNRYVITWYHLAHKTYGGSNDFQVILHEGGDIDFNYQNILTATDWFIGVNRGDGVLGTAYTGVLPHQKSLEIMIGEPLQDWIIVSPQNDLVKPHESTVVSIGVDGNKLEIGDLKTSLTFRSNSPSFIYYSSYKKLNLPLSLDIKVVKDAPPKAIAKVQGYNEMVPKGVELTFDGTQSTDDVEIVEWSWEIGGIEYVGPVVKHTFYNAGTNVVILTVIDEKGQNDIDIIALNVLDEWDTEPPVADAGPDQTAYVGVPMTLDGSSSTDNMEIANWTWDIDGFKRYGPVVTHTFTSPGKYTVTLNVTDGAMNFATDEMIVDVSDATDLTPPVADAGGNRVAGTGELITLDGSGSSDNIGIINWTWSVDGETYYGKVVPGISFDEPGSYLVELNVTDLVGNWNVDTVLFNITEIFNIPPVAQFTYTPETPAVGKTVVFEDISTDPDGTIVATLWVLDGLIFKEWIVSHVFENTGEYNVTLNVTDDRGATDSITRTIEIKDLNDIERHDVEIGPLMDSYNDPVMGAEAILTSIDGDEYSSDTDSEGMMVFEDVLPGTYTLKIVIGDYDESLDVIVRANGSVEYENIPKIGSSSSGPNDDDVEYLVSLPIGESISLDIDGTSVDILTLGAEEDEGTATVKIDRDIYDLELDDAINLDLDGDGRDDHTVELVGFESNGSPVLEFLSINDTDDGLDDDKENEGGEDGSEDGSSSMLWLVALILIIIGALLAFLFLRPREKTNPVDIYTEPYPEPIDIPQYGMYHPEGSTVKEGLPDETPGEDEDSIPAPRLERDPDGKSPDKPKARKPKSTSVDKLQIDENVITLPPMAEGHNVNWLLDDGDGIPEDGSPEEKGTMDNDHMKSPKEGKMDSSELPDDDDGLEELFGDFEKRKV